MLETGYEFASNETEPALSDIYLATRIDPEYMITVNVENKSFVISPEQYKLLLMGFNQTFKFHYNNATDYDDALIRLDYSDVDFNKATIDLADILQDFEVRAENASKYGWISDDYKMKQTYCKILLKYLNTFENRYIENDFFSETVQTTLGNKIEKKKNLVTKFNQIKKYL